MYVGDSPLAQFRESVILNVVLIVAWCPGRSEKLEGRVARHSVVIPILTCCLTLSLVGH